jgi:NDP-sugar pyrophosphorylase family protein
MDDINLISLFDLSTCSFQELFKNVSAPWEALKKIAPFLSSISLGRIDGTVSPQAYLVNPESIAIGAGTVVEPGAYIKGPCYIGPNCEIRHGAYVRGNIIADEGCVIGHDTEVKNSILLKGAKAGHFAYIGDSILGNEVNLGAGTKLANLRLDHGVISIRWKGNKISTGLKKLGGILGDGVQTGCNSVINPGTIMGKESVCYPCVNVHGVILPKKIVTHSSSPENR